MKSLKTVERIIGVFPLAEQHTMGNRFAKNFRYIVSQRLLPHKAIPPLER